MQVIKVDQMMFEVTRRCNMSCDHCLRGDTQSCDMSRKTITTALEQLKGATISNLGFTGGEPLLRPDLIRFILDELIRLDISVDQFTLITNGTICSKEILTLLTDLYAYAENLDEIGPFYFAISDDKFHRAAMTKQQKDKYVKNKHLFEMFSFLHTHGNNLPIAEGRAKNFGSYARYNDEFKVQLYDNGLGIMYGLLYINAKGQIVSDCDWSYETQEYMTCCNVDNMTEYFIEQTEEEAEEEAEEEKILENA